MPVIPSFGKYAPMPSLGQSFTSGANIATDARVARERIAADAAQAAARISLGRAQLAQESVENQMQLEAKKEFYSNQAMKQAQEAEIEKAYRDTQFGFKERELKNEEAMTAMRLKGAAQGFDQRMNYERRRSELIDSGMGEREASEQSARAFGFGEGGFGTSMGSSRERPMDAATKSSIKLLEGEIGENRRELLRTDDAEEKIAIQRKINRLTGSLQSLFPSMSPPSNGAVAPAAAQQQWQVNPESLPFGAPKNPSGFIGTPGGANQFQGPAPSANVGTNALRILSVRRR